MQQQEKDDISHRGDVIDCVVCLTRGRSIRNEDWFGGARDEQVCDGLGYR